MYYKIVLLCLIVILLFLGFSKVLADVPMPPESPKVAVVKSTPEFERIALCESNGQLHAKSKTSSASGEFQFLWGTWNKYGKEFWGTEFYKKNIWSTDNRELAFYVYKRYGTKDWESSSSCWSK